MTDTLSPEQRRRCMSRVRSKNTKPEIRLRKLLWSKGLRYRLHYNLPGKPDIVFVRKRIIVFVDGCFWHGCPEHSSIPKTNKMFWEKKLKRNKERDKEVTELLNSSGWTVLRYWTHELKQNMEEVVKQICRAVDGANTFKSKRN